MSDIRSIQFSPFVKNFEELLNEKFYSVSESKVVKMLEIGCGPGDFAVFLKGKLGSKVDYTAMDPGDDIEKALPKAESSGVNFVKGDIFEYQFDRKYDVVLFSKSLHHCNPVDKAVKIAYDLLEPNGIFFAEEFNPTHITLADKYWHFERFDLLRSTGCFISTEEKLKDAGYAKHMLTVFLDESLPIDERFSLRGKHNHNHHHGEHAHEHHHGEHGHEHNHHHHHEEPKKLHRDDPAGIAPFNEIIDVVEKQFGKEIVKSSPVPFFYNFFVMAGLKDNEAGQGGLREFMKQEQRAIDEKRINALGLNILAYKN